MNPVRNNMSVAPRKFPVAGHRINIAAIVVNPVIVRDFQNTLHMVRAALMTLGPKKII